jgi:hypothetical protein
MAWCADVLKRHQIAADSSFDVAVIGVPSAASGASA